MFSAHDKNAPAITWHSDPVGPDETVALAGWGLGDGIIEIRRLLDQPKPADADGDPAEKPRWQVVRPICQRSDALQFIVPSIMENGIYECRVRQGDWVSNTVLLNAPNVWWLQGDQGPRATPGGWVRLFGKCLGGQQAVRVALRAEGGEEHVLDAEVLDGFAITIRLPEGLSCGTYGVRVHAGFGAEAGWTDAASVEIAAALPGSDLVVNVMDFGAEPNTGKDCTAAVVRAMERLSAAGGGVLYFPRGRYRIDSKLRSGMPIAHPLRIPPGVTMRGQSKELVTLYWPERAEPLPTLLEGSHNFAVQDLTIYTHGRHRNIISGERGARIERVRIRANAFFCLDSVGKEHRGRNVSEHSCEMGTAIELTGEDVRVVDCDILHTGRAIVLKHVFGGLIARNEFHCGAGYVQFNGGERVIFERNHCRGAHLTATGGGLTLFYGAMAARHYYYAHNTIEHIYGGDRETLTLDGHGTAYVGGVSNVDHLRLQLTGEPTFSFRGRDGISDAREATLYIIAGKGVGQWRSIRQMEGQTLVFDRPWQVEPDEASVVYIGRFNGQHLIIGNEVSDSGYLTQLFPPNCQCIVAQNRGRRVGKIVSMGWMGYNRILMQRRIGPSWFNQFFDNEFVEGNGWGGEEREGFSTSGGGEAAMLVWGTLSSWVHDEHNHEHFRPLRSDEVPALLGSGHSPELLVSRWQIIRRHVGHSNSSIRVRGACGDVVIEDCSIRNADFGVIVEADAGGQSDPQVLHVAPIDITVRRNSFIEVRQPLSGDALSSVHLDAAEAPTAPAAEQAAHAGNGTHGPKRARKILSSEAQ